MIVKGKVVIITGSGRGLGKAFAQKLLEAGAKVCLSDLKRETGEATLNEFHKIFGKDRVHFVQCDVTNADQFKALYDECEQYFQDKLTILVNNAGVNTNFGWRKCMDVNILGVMTGVELALERMSTAKGGRGGLVVNTASMAGVVRNPISRMTLSKESVSDGLLSVYPYATSKNAVVALTRGLGQQPVMACHGVKFQCICPAWADTELVSSIDVAGKDLVDKSVVLSGGLMKPEYVADCFMKLITECDNGAAMAVVKNGPFLVPDTSTFYVIAAAIFGKIANKLTSGGVKNGGLIQIWHQVVFIMILLLLAHILFGWFLF